MGLEIKREVLAGELSSVRHAALPIAGAVGGMVVPAAIFLLASGPDAASGWAIPMATDIAFALGVLALAAPRAPTGLKVFLAALAIVDDMGAVLVIAAFYTGEIAWNALALAGLVLIFLIGLNRLRIKDRRPTCLPASSSGSSCTSLACTRRSRVCCSPSPFLPTRESTPRSFLIKPRNCSPTSGVLKPVTSWCSRAGGNRRLLSASNAPANRQRLRCRDWSMHYIDSPHW